MITLEPQLLTSERFAAYGDVTIHKDRPETSEEKVRRAEGADVIMNTRGAVKWGEDR